MPLCKGFGFLVLDKVFSRQMKSVLSLAKEAAVRAGKLVASHLGKTAIERKGPSYDLITEADRKAEELIAVFLSREMPGCEILGREDPLNPCRRQISPLILYARGYFLT
jgi:3'-phosphoadenosine 5'-phosphosulfate (PAPS) 3'-phosphatase